MKAIMTVTTRKGARLYQTLLAGYICRNQLQFKTINTVQTVNLCGLTESLGLMLQRISE